MGKEWSLFAEDEFSIDLQTGMSPVWVKKGTKPLCPTTTRKGKAHIFGALNNETGKVIIQECDKIDKYSFLKFLKKLLRYYKKVCFVLDNASWHHARIIQDFVKKNRRRLLLLFIPPYSPEYNPSEQCWKAVKRDLLTSRLFLSIAGMIIAIQHYFAKKRLFKLKLERFLCS